MAELLRNSSLQNSENATHQILQRHCRLRKNLMRMRKYSTDPVDMKTLIHLAMECLNIASPRRRSFSSEDNRVEELTSLQPLQILYFSKPLELKGQMQKRHRTGIQPLFIYLPNVFISPEKVRIVSFYYSLKLLFRFRQHLLNRVKTATGFCLSSLVKSLN